MALGVPILITLYDSNDEKIETFGRARVPVEFIERAMELGEIPDSAPKEQLAALYQLVVDFYGEKFTLSELRKGCSLAEIKSVVEAIVNRAGEAMAITRTLSANPTRPGKAVPKGKAIPKGLGKPRSRSAAGSSH